MKRFIAVAVLAFSFTAVFAAPVKISSKGEAEAAIIVDFDAPRTVQFAARELQNYIRKITTARLPILHTMQGWKVTSIVLGTVDSPLVKPLIKTDLNAAKIKDDGYAIRVRGKSMVIYAKNPRGVLNGVHRFIHNYTDFVWVRPYKEQSVYSVIPTLTLNVRDQVDNPSFRMRSWSANRHMAYYSEEYEMYLSRLCNNLTPSPRAASLGRQLDHGFMMEYGGGHNLSTLWLPKNVFGKSNPEFYMLNNGERRVTGRVQLCYTNRKMWDAFAKNALKIISKLPKHYTRVNMMIDDTNSLCDCDECRKPITLPDGSVLKVNEPAFRSTQFYIFLNYVAEKVYQKYPDLEIKCYGYFFTAEPPRVKIFKNICVSFCPYVRNDKEDLHGKSNVKWLERTRRYAAMSPNVIWREYYYCSRKFPRAQANVIAKDLRYINKLGIRMIFPETSWADRPSPNADAEFSENDFYTMAGPEFWTINQLYWNSSLDPDAVRNDYIRRTYREGAPGVQKFYKILRDSWFLDPTPASFNDDFKRDMGYYVVRKKLVAPCRAALAEAAKTVRDPRSAECLKRLTSTFERWVKAADSSISAEQKVPKAEIREFPGFDFESGVWAKAAKLTPFSRMGKRGVMPPEPTDVKVIHNGEVLYVAFRCPTPGKPVGKSQLKPEGFPSGDHVEIFIANPNDGYYHLAFNFHGKQYDSIGTNAEWNTKWEVRTQVKEGEWRGVAMIPLKSVNLVIEQNNRVRALFYRCRRGNGAHNVHSSWEGGQVHSVSSFGELVFLHE